MSVNDGTPLKSVRGWPESVVNKLSQLWITTAEQVVGMAATPATLSSLQSEMGVSEDEMAKLVESARSSLPPETANKLSQPVDTSRRGLGALRPDAR